MGVLTLLRKVMGVLTLLMGVLTLVLTFHDEVGQSFLVL